MREKPANEQAIEKTILFLKRVQLDCLNNMQFGKGAQSLYELMKFFKISRRTSKACFDLAILKPDKEKKYIWGIGNPNNGNIDYRLHALKILDHLLKESKRTVHYPIPDFAAFGESLKAIGERLVMITLQQEQLLKRPKTGHTEETGDLTQRHIFEQEQQRQKDRVYLAGQIASRIYYDVIPHPQGEDFKLISGINERIISATDDLLNQLYS